MQARILTQARSNKGKLNNAIDNPTIENPNITHRHRPMPTFVHFVALLINCPFHVALRHNIAAMLLKCLSLKRLKNNLGT